MKNKLFKTMTYAMLVTTGVGFVSSFKIVLKLNKFFI